MSFEGNLTVEEGFCTIADGSTRVCKGITTAKKWYVWLGRRAQSRTGQLQGWAAILACDFNSLRQQSGFTWSETSNPHLRQNQANSTDLQSCCFLQGELASIGHYDNTKPSSL